MIHCQSPTVDVIGAGVAGLCLGIRLLRRGARVVIYEAGKSAGGLCVNWRRADYDFNGCLHWVLGSRPGSSFYDMWRTVCDIDSLSFIDFDERADIELPDENGGFWHFHFYNDVERFRAYLIELAPDDSSTVGQWLDAVKTVARLLPDLPPFPTESSRLGRIAHYVSLCRMWPMLPLLAKWHGLTTRSFARRFKSLRLRQAVESLYMNETSMTVVIFGQAYMASRVASYPLGGSRSLSNLLLDTFTSLGGCIEFGARVESVRVENDRAVGLRIADGRETSADAVCSCADWRWTVGQALGGRYATASQLRLLSAPKESFFFSYCRVHLGVAASLSELPHFLRLAICGILPDGTPFEQIEVEVNNFDPSLAPEGKTTVTANFTTREGGWWISLRQSDYGAYGKAKNEVAKIVLDALALRFPRLFSPSPVEVVDVTTPATYHRFTSNTLGSSQGWAPMPRVTKRLPVGSTLHGLSRFALAGHWLEAGGGLPIALVSALRAENALASQLHLKTGDAPINSN